MSQSQFDTLMRLICLYEAQLARLLDGNGERNGKERNGKGRARARPQRSGKGLSFSSRALPSFTTALGDYEFMVMDRQHQTSHNKCTVLVVPHEDTKARDKYRSITGMADFCNTSPSQRTVFLFPKFVHQGVAGDLIRPAMQPLASLLPRIDLAYVNYKCAKSNDYSVEWLKIGNLEIPGSVIFKTQCGQTWVEDRPVVLGRCGCQDDLSKAIADLKNAQCQEPPSQVFCRALKFTCAPTMWQTETYYTMQDGKEHFFKTKIVDTYAQSMLSMMLYGNAMRANPAQPNILLIGVGGGIMMNWINEAFPMGTITGVELDPAVADIACDFFGLELSERCRMVVGCGMDFIEKAYRQGKKYDCIIFDANDPNDEGQTVPPRCFSNNQFYSRACQLLNPDGVIVNNVCCKDPERLKLNMDIIEGNSNYVIKYQIPDYWNYVVLGCPGNAPRPFTSEERRNLVSRMPLGYKNGLLSIMEDIDKCERPHTNVST